MKILFMIKALANPGGGAEKVLTQVASGLARRGHEVTVLTNDASLSAPYYPLADDVRLLRLGIGNTRRKSGLGETLRRMSGYRSIVQAERPDVVVAFMHSTYIPVALALFGSGVPIVASEHAGPEHYRTRPLQKTLMQVMPFLVRRITVVSAQIMGSFGGWLKRGMMVMPNPVVVHRAKNAAVASQAGRKMLLSVGRLSVEKDHRTLIAAFAVVSPRHPDWYLRIVGEGELRASLERQVHEGGLGHRVELPGAISDIDAEYRAADLFVLPSSYESFGLATAEALLYRLPAIGFADCAGTNELILDNVNGRLVHGDDRVEALSVVLDQLMSDPQERQRLADTPRDGLVDRFGLAGVLDRWERLLADVVGTSIGQSSVSPTRSVRKAG